MSSSCNCDQAPDAVEEGTSEAAVGEAKDLELVREAKIDKLLPHPHGKKRFESSGVVLSGEKAWVVFDSLTQIAELDLGLEGGGDRWLGERDGYRVHKLEGFEGIARDPGSGRLYLLIEALERDDQFFAGIVSLAPATGAFESFWLEPALAKSNKGLEGVTFIERDGRKLLLTLCEANKCKKGKPGNGKVRAYEDVEGKLTLLDDDIDVPSEVAFEDYSGLVVRGDKVAIVSQEESRLWIGRIDTSNPDAIALKGPGRTYTFPKEDGEVVYCNVEGVDFIDDETVVVVSDRRKTDQNKRCRGKDQSIHVFSLP